MSLVEYHDPDDIFHVVAPEVRRRLPLTNLHWKAASRPLRSIESLHVDLVRGDDRDGGVNGGPEAPADDDEGKNTLRSADDQSKSAARSVNDHNVSHQPAVRSSKGQQQRHQIPGLRQTPYLKLYILRCDDKETYKSTTKDVVRAWMKANAPAAGHDAFEWLILHVVLPGTPAASEPRWSKKPPANVGGGGDHADAPPPKERVTSGGSRWAGKGSRTILERLRADFNQTGKAAPDRIAQVRVAREAVPAGLGLPKGEEEGEAAPADEMAAERVNACDDLIAKMKTLILKSFDQRVGRYEDDIREKESQQSLPGWNFCTFFVLKEGLARAFESVGLLDDALAVYDELDAGLETSLRDRAFGADAGQATSFLPFTPELHDRLVATRNGERSLAPPREAPVAENPLPLSSIDKDYRHLIVSNDISIFDFRCYLFARQMSLLLRQASIRSSIRSAQYPAHENGTVSSQDLSSDTEPPQQPGAVHNAMALAEICRRAVQFVPSIARILRVDLRAGFDAEGADMADVESTIDKAVLSITFSVAQQILDATATSDIAASLPVHETNATESSSSSSNRSDRRVSRRSSMPASQHSAASARGQIFGTDASILYSQGFKSVPVIQNAELSNAAAYRAELYLLQRRVLEGMGGHFRLYVSRGERRGSETSEPETAGSERDHGARESASIEPRCAQLRHAVASAEEFSKLYEALTDRATFHYAAANRIKSAEKLTVDVAKLKLADGDYAAAALYFNQIIPSFSTQSWNSVESSILHLYAECLKALHRKDEYVRVSLALLKKAAEARGPPVRQQSDRRARPTRRQKRPAANGNDSALSIYKDLFSELVTYAQTLPYDFSSPLDAYFANLKIDSSIIPFEEHDGFKLALTVEQLLADRLRVDHVTVRLINPTDSQAREILLQNEEPCILGPGETQIWLNTNTSSIGNFIVDKIKLQVGKLVFVNEPLKKSEPQNILTPSSEAATSRPRAAKSSPILLYQRVGALYAEINSSKATHIGKRRFIDVTLDPGSNDIESAALILKSATAGLRLHCGDATTAKGDQSITDQSQPGRIDLATIPAGAELHIQVPYDLERNVAELFIRMEVHYKTSHGDFIFTASPVVHIELAVDINVQDVFKEHFFYAKFLVQPLNSIPLHLVASEMSSSTQYLAEPLLRDFDPFTVLPHQPANVTYRVSKKDAVVAANKKPPSLLLTVSYLSLQDEVAVRIASALGESLDDSPFRHLRRLLLQTLRKSLHLHFPVAEYEDAAITGQVGVPKFEAVSWADVLDGLRQEDRLSLRQWLEKWHSNHANLSISSPNDPDYATTHPDPHRVLIDFELVDLKYLHTTSLTLVANAPPSSPAAPSSSPNTKTQSSPSFSAPTVARVGEPLQTRFETRHTRRWDLSSSSSNSNNNKSTPITTTNTKTKTPEEEFEYEIHADPTEWLVVGRRRARFTAKPDASSVFDVSLVPVRTGLLFLPAVEVLPVQPEQDGKQTSGGREGHGNTNGNGGANNNGGSNGAGGAWDDNGVPRDPRATSQTDCTSVHFGVEVVEGMGSTTVGVGVGEELDAGVALLGAEGATGGYGDRDHRDGGIENEEEEDEEEEEEGGDAVGEESSP